MSDEGKIIQETFLKACKENNLKKARACLDLDVDVNCSDGEAFALWYAVENDNLELFQLLMEQSDIDENQVTKPNGAKYNHL